MLVQIGRRNAGSSVSKQGSSMPAPLLELEKLQKYFPISTGALLRRKLGWVKAVDGVDFAVWPGETLGLIGESGCGKTTTSKLILLQETPTAGTIGFVGEDISALQGQHGSKVYVANNGNFSGNTISVIATDVDAKELAGLAVKDRF